MLFKEIKLGRNARVEELEKLSQYVLDNWDVLFAGAKRASEIKELPVQVIGSDYWAPQRIQVGLTRLHKDHGVKYANGVKYTEFDSSLTDEDLRKTAQDVIHLCGWAEMDITSRVHIDVPKRK